MWQVTLLGSKKCFLTSQGLVGAGMNCRALFCVFFFCLYFNQFIVVEKVNGSLSYTMWFV